MDIDLISLIFTLVASIISVTWTISNTKHNQEARIAAIKSEFLLVIKEVKHRQELLETNNNNDHETFKYMDNDIRGALEHKAKRLENMIKDINYYLESNGNFKARNGFDSSEG